jgi:hypothetical protein
MYGFNLLGLSVEELKQPIRLSASYVSRPSPQGGYYFQIDSRRFVAIRTSGAIS